MRIILIGVSFLLMISCAKMHMYQPPVQQGNVLTNQMTEKLKPGMSRQQVENILGQSVLENAFQTQEIIYIDLYDTKTEKINSKHVKLTFHNNQLTQIQKNIRKRS